MTYLQNVMSNPLVSSCSEIEEPLMFCDSKLKLSVCVCECMCECVCIPVSVCVCMCTSEVMRDKHILNYKYMYIHK